MAEDIKNLCAPIPASLHQKVRKEQGASGKTLGEYMTWLLKEFYENGGKPTMAKEEKTVAFAVPEELFEQLKEYLKRNKLTQKAFFVDCIQRALADEEG